MTHLAVVLAEDDDDRDGYERHQTAGQSHQSSKHIKTLDQVRQASPGPYGRRDSMVLGNGSSPRFGHV